MKENPFLESLLRWQMLAEKYVDRREFLKTHVKGALLLAVGSCGLIPSRPLAAPGIPDIGIARGDPGPATRAAIGLLGGIKAFVKPGNKVVIKPNMSFAYDPDAATNTHPEVVRELVALCKEAGALKIRVLDHTLHREEPCIEGVRQACQIFNGDIVHALSKKDFYKAVHIQGGIKFKKTDVMKDALDADVLIAAPVAKTHSSTGVSLSMKGMMGLIWNRSIMHWRYDLSEAIVDLCTLLKPHLVVIDATNVLSTNGPGGPGKVLHMNTVIASRDMVAADAQAVHMFQWYGQRLEPRQVKHIRLAHERGLGRMDIQTLTKKKVEA